MNSTLVAPSIATAELFSQLENHVAVIAPDIPTLIPKRIVVERVGLTNNAALTPYVVYRVGERRCCTFIKRRVFFDCMQLLLKVNGIGDRIRSITIDAANRFRLLLGNEWKLLENGRVAHFVQECNNRDMSAPPKPQPGKTKLPTNYELLEGAKDAGAIAYWFEHEEESGMFWVWKPSSEKAELVTSTWLPMWLRKLEAANV